MADNIPSYKFENDYNKISTYQGPLENINVFINKNHISIKYHTSQHKECK